jgi:iron complex outermembrane receptor protein
LRLSARRRGASFLVIGTLAAPDLLTFSPLTTVDLRLFVDVGEFLPKSSLAKGTRVTLGFLNLANERQIVRNANRTTPQAYQPIYRDPVGRTFSIELRKVF